MARIVGVDIPRNKKVIYSLRYIHGIGLMTAKELCEISKVDPNTRVQDLTDEQIDKFTEMILSLRDKVKAHIEYAEFKKK